MKATINGNMVTFTGLSEMDVLLQIQRRHLAVRQFTAMGQPDGTVHLTFPMSPLERGEFAGLIHRYNAEQRAKNKHLEHKGVDPTPPKGTPPRGGAGNTKEFVNTSAIAA
jgi:hypothetical protein